MAGLSRTSVANSSLMLGATPVLVALLSAMLGIDRIGRLHWVGAALSMTGIYLVVGTGFSLGSHGATGDLLMIAAVCCWAIYTIGARPADDAPLAGRRDWHLDDDRDADVPAAGVAQPARAALERDHRLGVGRADLLGRVRPVHLVHDLVRRGPATRQRADFHLLQFRAHRRHADGRRPYCTSRSVSARFWARRPSSPALP